jgi:hypothetical protein
MSFGKNIVSTLSACEAMSDSDACRSIFCVLNRCGFSFQEIQKELKEKKTCITKKITRDNLMVEE